ncbi:hypothetical protein LPJ74_004778 [Coemansia sp. RSA 1843]|nr:hypothetical protein LPJ74_004778 [Coemansia sp. RSA 1843]
MAHDFPPFLRRLWLYQSIISVNTATVLLPIGVLFEQTSRKESSLRRLFLASIRWMMCAGLALFVWEAACQRSSHLQALGFYRLFSTGGATIRYSVYHATCIFASLPVVLVIVPRGTWALFSWIKCCVGQKHELAHVARMRYRKLKHERAKIERQLQKAIGSWKWERIRDSDEAWVLDDFCDIEAKKSPSLRSPPASRSRNSISDLPPLHPGLSPKMDSVESRPYRTVAYRQSRISARPRFARGGGVLPGSAIFQPQDVSMDYAPSFHQTSANATPNLQSASMFLYQSDGTDSSDDGANDSWTNQTTQRTQRQQQLERERAMKQLSRQIRKYHAQLLFIREDMRRLDESEVLGMADNDVSNTDSISSSRSRSQVFKRTTLMSLAGSASSILVTVTASLCWLLVVLQVGRGALSAIFVGEPDLTHNFTYFIPALPPGNIDGLGSAAAATAAGYLHSSPGSASGFSKQTNGSIVWQRELIPPLATLCQMISSALLFVVVMFGVLSMGSSVEDSVHPLRFLIASYSGSLLRARQWHWLPYFLLSEALLVRINPTCVVAHFASSNQLGCVAGNTSRVFFSSSRDLTSFYRGLLRQAAGSSAVPTTLLPGGILPESFLQAKAWGKRVFLLFGSNAKNSSSKAEGSGDAVRAATPSRDPQPVSTKQLLTYTWIVCGLAMTWPSVLRTTGLISERAYVLPITSLVQPLWTQYKNDQDLSTDTAGMPPVYGATEPGEGTVGLLTNPAAPINEAVAEECSSGVCSAGDVAYALPLFVASNELLFCDNRQNTIYSATTLNVNNSAPDTSPKDIYASLKREPLEPGLASNDFVNAPLTSTSNPAPTAAARTMAFTRKISRKQLHQSLFADTLQGKLVRWSVGLACKITPHACISAGYIVWWMSPDLIVPLSPVTVDMQLGYLPPLDPGSYPVLVSPSLAMYSEWYGMLRRLERGSIWLPHADDGTPLRLQPANMNERKPSERKKHAHHLSVNKTVVPAKRGWMQMAYGSIVHGLRVFGLKLRELLYVLTRRLWSAVVLCTRVATGSVADRVRDTRAGAAIGASANAMVRIGSGVGFIADSVWEAVLAPLWYCISLAAGAIFGCIALVASYAASAVASVLDLISIPSRDIAAAQVGVTSAAPPLFINEYWESAAVRGGSPALQRLRPELWPHVFGGSAEGALILHDVAAQPQQPASLLHKGGQGSGGHGKSGASNAKSTAALSAKSDITAKQSLGDTSTLPTFGVSQQEHSAAAQTTAKAGEGGDGRTQAQKSRKAWTTLDWLLAAYRVALSILAIRTVFRPSRSSRLFSV